MVLKMLNFFVGICNEGVIVFSDKGIFVGVM